MAKQKGFTAEQSIMKLRVTYPSQKCSPVRMLMPW